MKTKLQVEHLKEDIDRLQRRYGNPKLNAIYGAGCISRPKLLFLFMNPTARNISSFPGWNGLRAPWIGTKNIWKLYHALEILDRGTFYKTQGKWTEDLAYDVYHKLSKKSVYITNLAKCTQEDARALKNAVFKAYLANTQEEIYAVNPTKIISFGDRVSSVLLGKKIKVSDFQNNEKEVVNVKNKNYDVYPVCYPVGQGIRNINKAVQRIKSIWQLP